MLHKPCLGTDGSGVDQPRPGLHEGVSVGAPGAVGTFEISPSGRTTGRGCAAPNRRMSRATRVLAVANRLGPSCRGQIRLHGQSFLERDINRTWALRRFN